MKLTLVSCFWITLKMSYPELATALIVTDVNGTVVKDVHGQQALDGTGTQKVKFEKPGPIDVTVRVEDVQGENMGAFVESADFNLYVSN